MTDEPLSFTHRDWRRCSQSTHSQGYDYHVVCSYVDAFVDIFYSILFLAFLTVFRTNQAYARYWDGAKLLRQSRADWLSASSAVIAFCSSDNAHRPEVEEFQHFFVRLMSLLVCTSLQAVSNQDSMVMPVINLDGIDPTSLKFLQSKPDRGQKCEIILQWIQRLVAETSKTPVLPIAPPLLTRFFQELTNGVVLANEARNLSDIPFPFPYAQMMTLLLMFHVLVTPIIMVIITQNAFWAAIFTFVSITVLWGTNYTAIAIEYPFGLDDDSLPLESIQADVNASLWLLLEKECRQTPAFTFEKHVHRRWAVTCVTLNGDGTAAPPFEGVSSHMTFTEMTAEPSQRTRAKTLYSRPSTGLGPAVKDYLRGATLSLQLIASYVRSSTRSSVRSILSEPGSGTVAPGRRRRRKPASGYTTCACSFRLSSQNNEDEPVRLCSKSNLAMEHSI